MNKQQETLKLALEALKAFHYAMIDAGVLDRQEVLNQGFTAFTAIKQALADSALERMAENARELGLDYEPAQQRPQNCGTGYCSCIECPYEQQESKQ